MATHETQLASPAEQMAWIAKQTHGIPIATDTDPTPVRVDYDTYGATLRIDATGTTIDVEAGTFYFTPDATITSHIGGGVIFQEDKKPTHDPVNPYTASSGLRITEAGEIRHEPIFSSFPPPNPEKQSHPTEDQKADKTEQAA